jgi:hypothetical protein
MRQGNLGFIVASAAIASLSGLVPVNVHAQTPQAGTQGPPQAAEDPYDWKASFAKYPVGKVPRTLDGDRMPEMALGTKNGQLHGRIFFVVKGRKEQRVPLKSRSAIHCDDIKRHDCFFEPCLSG